MSNFLLLLVPLLLLPIVLLLAFAGCTGEDPELERKLKEAEAAAAAADQKIKDDATKAAQDIEDKKYVNVIKKEPDLICLWRLDELETGDMTAKDSAPVDERHGEYKVPQSVSRGESGALVAMGEDPNDKAAEFDGGYVEVPFSPVLNPPDSFTVEAWIRPESGPDPQVVIASYEMGSGGGASPIAGVVRGFVLEVLPGTTTLVLQARVGNGDGFTSVEASLGDGSEHDGWRHVALTYSGSTNALKLYVNADDGKAEAELPSPTVPAPVNYSPNLAAPLRIGAGQQEQPPAPTPALYFKGRIDEVALYRVALDGVKIKDHWEKAS